MAGSTSLPDHVSRILVAEDWEGDVRHTFHRLYVVEDKALPQAMTEMVELLGFQATERQYKRKIKAWGLDKNIKDEEMRAIINLQRKRKQEDGKESTFFVRDRLVDQKKIARFAQRKNIIEEEASLLSSDSFFSGPQPPIRCCSPASPHSPKLQPRIQEHCQGNAKSSQRKVWDGEIEDSQEGQTQEHTTLPFATKASKSRRDIKASSHKRRKIRHSQTGGPIQDHDQPRSIASNTIALARRQMYYLDLLSDCIAPKGASLEYDYTGEIFKIAAIMESEQLRKQRPVELRRLSVRSLLTDGSTSDSDIDRPSPPRPLDEIFGSDYGFPDLDLPKHNDTVALQGNFHNAPKEALDDHFAEFGSGLQRSDAAYTQDGYYAKPVIVTIPRDLGPLPTILLENPMNMLYFHYFFNHISRLLVAHDCSANPFRKILPQMALQDINLLHSLLAYSARHRASLLNHREPTNRIAIWLRDVLQALNHELSSAQISNANIATVIMLAMIEFKTQDPDRSLNNWQKHLNGARQMILARGGASSFSRKDKVSCFLMRWLARLDMFNGLTSIPLFPDGYWSNDNSDDDFQIDCIFGVTHRYLNIMAKMAELFHQQHRILTHNSLAIKKLRVDLQEARMHPFRACSNIADDGLGLLEVDSTNTAFHWACLIYLNLNLNGPGGPGLAAGSTAEIQIAVQEIVNTLYKVRPGGSADACLLIPLLAAGGIAQDQRHKMIITERLKGMESASPWRVDDARMYMEKIFKTYSYSPGHGKSIEYELELAGPDPI